VNKSTPLQRLLLLACLASGAATAQCVNSGTPSCGVYDSCFAQLCSCAQSPFEYFRSYGKKYCEVFLQLPGLSKAGLSWRDATLRCLQEKIVPMLPPDGQAASCNCQGMQTTAFDTHVQCYTQPSHSICDLPASDWAAIFDAAGGVSSLVDAKSRKQIIEVAKVCVPRVGEPLRARMQKFITQMQ
jgi:hypothetical protein